MIPFFNVYLQQRGLSGAEIGWLGSIGPLVTLIANPFWGAVADRWQIYRQVLFICAVGVGGVCLLFLQADRFWLFLPLVTALFFFRNPMLAILDGTVMGLVQRTRANYGAQRAWGTVGFCIASLGVGQLLTAKTLSLTFWIQGILFVLGCGLLSLIIPVVPMQRATNIWRGVKTLLGQRSLISFFLALILMGMALSTYTGFLGMLIVSLGGAEQQVGWAWGTNSLLEVPMMYFGARWLGRYQNRQLILAGAMGYSVIFTLIGLAGSPLLVIILVLAVGVCFGTYWVAVVGYAAESAPSGLQATTQAMVGVASNGFGWSLGSVVSGYLWDHIGGNAVFFFAALCTATAAVIFWKGRSN